MTPTDSENRTRKEAMKKLREKRKEMTSAASALFKKHQKAIRSIKEVLKEGGRTVPEMAEGTGMPSSEVFWYIATMKKYGEVVEGAKEGAYFCYELADGAGAETNETPLGRVKK